MRVFKRIMLWWRLRQLKSKTGKKQVQRNTTLELGRIGDVRAVPPLLKGLTAERSPIRREVAWALGKLGDFRAVGSLVDMLKESDPSVREVAAKALLYGIGAEQALATQALEQAKRDLKMRQWGEEREIRERKKTEQCSTCRKFLGYYGRCDCSNY